MSENRQPMDNTIRDEAEVPAQFQRIVGLPHGNPYIPLLGGLEDDSQKFIPAFTVFLFITGVYSKSIEVIDTRPPDLFGKSHITGAISLYNAELIAKYIKRNYLKPSKPQIIILYGRTTSDIRLSILTDIFRKIDRYIHKDEYPQLTYPEVYCLEDGYDNFFREHPVRFSFPEKTQPWSLVT